MKDKQCSAAWDWNAQTGYNYNIDAAICYYTYNYCTSYTVHAHFSIIVTYYSSSTFDSPVSLPDEPSPS